MDVAAGAASARRQPPRRQPGRSVRPYLVEFNRQRRGLSCCVRRKGHLGTGHHARGGREGHRREGVSQRGFLRDRRPDADFFLAACFLAAGFLADVDFDPAGAAVFFFPVAAGRAAALGFLREALAAAGFLRTRLGN